MNNSIDNQSDVLNQKPIYKPEQKKYDISPTNGTTLLVVSVLLGFIFTICFSDPSIFPNLSLLVFTIFTVVFVPYIFRKFHCLQNSKGLIWAIPMLFLATCNLIFSINAFTYLNCLAELGLLAIYSNALLSNKPLFSGFTVFFKRTFSTLLPDKIGVGMFLLFNIIKTNSEQGHSTKVNHFKKILIGVVLSLPFLIIITTLLFNGDLVFRELINHSFSGFFDYFKGFDLGKFYFRTIVFFISTFYIMGYLYHSKVNKKEYTSREMKTGIDRTISITFLTMLNALFLVFCVIQFTYLFTDGVLTLPADFTYAEYARKGFFELLFVSCINFAVVIAFLNFMKRMDNKSLVKKMLFALCVFTGLLISSSFYRMFMYVDSYGFTILRVAVLTFLIMECILIAMATISIFKENLQLFKSSFYVSLCFYLLVNILASEPTVTWLNIERFHQTGKFSNQYFAEETLVDSLGMMREFYQEVPNDEDAEIKDNLSKGINRIESNLNNEQSHWQNYSIIKELNTK
ncbi:MAG: hypothetical protein K0R71_2347 [Bacillales bacterium]|jgi:hypothetical protein|nr:hypothetical protein [Bacillales bacterium]